jgi:hypothetical protein
MKIASSGMMSSMNSNNNNPSINSDNRIKFVDMLVCGSCQQDFQLSDIVKFIEHKAICGNKENKRKIPYFLSQRRQREGGDDDDDDDDDDDEEDKSQQSGNSSGNENEHHSNRQQLSQKQSKYSKVLVDASANTLHNSGIHNNDLFEEKKNTPLILLLLVEPYNFECSRCGDVYSTGKNQCFIILCYLFISSLVSDSTLSTFTWYKNVQYMSQWKSFSER